MHKKHLSCAILLAAVSITIPAVAHFTLSLGAQSTQMDIESEAERFLRNPDPDPDADTTLNLTDSEDNQDTSIGGELALGYQFDFNTTLNVALEIFGQLSAAHVDTPIYSNYTDFLTSSLSAPVQDATASFKWIAGVRLRPGYYVTPSTRLFIDGGVVWGDFKLEQTDAVVEYWNNLFANEFDVDADFDQTETEVLFGWRYGAGVEHNVTDNFIVGLDFIITEFNEFNSNSVEEVAELATDLPGAFSASAQSTYAPTLTTIGLNFKYIFGVEKPEQPPSPPQEFYPVWDK